MSDASLSKSLPTATEPHSPASKVNPGELLHIRPMEAVRALYSSEDVEVADALVSSLSRAVFGKGEPAPASLVQRALARVTCRVLTWTTRHHKADAEAGVPAHYRNRVLERSKHPYAHALLASSSLETAVLVEGGDPMNGPYMMICPEIRSVCTLWDRLFFNNVQGRDVQLRMICETRATYEAASRRLEQGHKVRMKALAAGTGLSMILAYDRLLRDGHDPMRITAKIADRDESSSVKTGRLLAKLAEQRGWKLGDGSDAGISVHTEDVFEDVPVAEVPSSRQYDVVTAVGILEYLQGFTCDTTERRHRVPEPDELATAIHLAERLGAMTTEDAALIVNTYRPHSSTRILELFGKRFDYREIVHLSELLATANFRPARLVGSGVIYDVKVYCKVPPETA